MRDVKDRTMEEKGTVGVGSILDLWNQNLYVWDSQAFHVVLLEIRFESL